MTVYQVQRQCLEGRYAGSWTYRSLLFATRAAAEAFLAAAEEVDLWIDEDDCWQSCTELKIIECEVLDEFTGLPEV